MEVKVFLLAVFIALNISAIKNFPTYDSEESESEVSEEWGEAGNSTEESSFCEEFVNGLDLTTAKNKRTRSYGLVELCEELINFNKNDTNNK